MTAYAAKFREIVVPRLARLCVVEARRVVYGEQTFGDAVDAILAESRRLGASYLPPDVLTDLHDWIQSKMLAEVDTLEQARTTMQEQIEVDPIGHYSLLAFEFPALKWTFAAISPEYRRFLLEGEHARR